MAFNVQELFGLPRLMGMIEETTSGLPQEEVMLEKLPGLLNLKRQIVGNVAQAALTKGQRKVSKIIPYSSAPVAASLETIGQRDYSLLHTSEVITMDPVIFQNLRMWDSFQFQTMGGQEVGRQIELFKQKFANLRVSNIISALVYGAQYFDTDGNFLPSSSGADASKTIDHLVSANHKNQLNGIIDVPWSNPNANIPKHIQAIIRQGRIDTGRVPTLAIYGESVLSWILQNNYCQSYNSFNLANNNSMMNDMKVPKGFMELDWIAGNQFFFEDSTGTNQRLVPDDYVIFLPIPSKTWYELVEGSMPVPTTINPIMDVNSAWDQMKTVYGEFAYAQFTQRPINMDIVGGDTFVPVLRNPDVLFQADVEF